MKKRIIEITVNDEYVVGSGVVIGAKGDDESVALRVSFNDTWLGLNIYATFRDAGGENPTAVLLCPSMLVPGEVRTYDVVVPKSATAIDGKMCVVFSGFVVTESRIYDAAEDEYDKLVYRDAVINTANAYFRVLPSDFSALDVEDQQEATALEQALAEINGLYGRIVEHEASVGESIEEQDAVIETFKSDADAAIQSCKNTEESLKQAAKNGDFDGYTPKRGVDYWTPEDEAETKAYIDEQLTDIDKALDCIIAIQEELLGIEKSSKGLSFMADGDGYAVMGIGTCTDTDIIIPSEYEGLPVIGIEIDAFFANNKITSVTIPDSVTRIAGWAFQKCTRLTRVKMGSGVVNIEEDAFQGCSSLTNVSLPRSIQIIASDAFGGCTNLTDIYVPWNEGEIAGAPWGATGATIHYNSEV